MCHLYFCYIHVQHCPLSSHGLKSLLIQRVHILNIVISLCMCTMWLTFSGQWHVHKTLTAIYRVWLFTVISAYFIHSIYSLKVKWWISFTFHFFDYVFEYGFLTFLQFQLFFRLIWMFPGIVLVLFMYHGVH